MSLKIENGVYPLDAHGYPVEITGLAELTQDITLALTLPRGTLRAAPELGSTLAGLDLTAENAAEQAVILAKEALLGWPGVTVQGAEIQSDGIHFTVGTPLGETEVLYGIDDGNDEADS